ncbi:hypothetical protein EV356DRAFT_526156 [Viridothelium virens]|uniref:NB-ARC domain-containing protein n=1 Tax=Viridothelium virens TaxID=1048519 RepID=A0A6A6HKA0_VIRVR|nr:hypothetical protein EV356DRAFT_526156 [Viridothelium virens]
MGDPNAYTTGRIGSQNVVLAFPPGIGKSVAASAAASLRSSFTGIKLGLLVGICGGAPLSTDGTEILLGDVIISTAIVQYDFGRLYPNKIMRKDELEDTLGRPNQEIRAFLRKLEGKQSHAQLEEDLLKHIIVGYPGKEEDILYQPIYRHKHQNGSCPTCLRCEGEEGDVCEDALHRTCAELMCDKAHQVVRDRLVERRNITSTSNPTVALGPRIHFGRVASGDSVIKAGLHRDRIASNENVIAFEMEAAGTGVSDYADSHKNKKWQTYAAVTAAACAKAFLERWVRMDTSPSNPRQKSFWYIPLRRNDKFVGRAAQLQELEEKLLLNGGVEKVAIAGLGGVGKTQIALELAYRPKELTPDWSVIWIPASSTEAIERAYADIVERLQIPGWNDKQADHKLLLQRHLSKESTGRWLLIFDNADDIDMWVDKDKSRRTLQHYLPRSEQGHIMFTTRDRKAAVMLADPNVVPVVEMDEAAGVELLRARLMDKELLENGEDSLNLLSELTYLPLAIVQAAAYINANGITSSDYFGLLAEQEQGKIDSLSEEFDEARKSVAVTWSISFEQIQSRNCLAAEYLSLMACVEPEAVPLSFLPLVDSRKRQADALGLLDAYSFITRRSGGQSIDLHHLVHLATRNWLCQNSSLSSWTEKAKARLEEVFPNADPENRNLWRMYLPHVRYALCLDDAGEEKEASRNFLMKIGACLNMDGRYCEAERIFVEVSKINKRVLGEEHPDTMYSLLRLFRVYLAQGRFKELNDLGLQMLDTVKLRSGEGHLVTTYAIVTLLAHSSMHQLQLKETKNLAKQIVGAMGQDIGEEDHIKLFVARVLSLSYQNRDRLEEAEKLTKRRTPREGSLDTYTSTNSLASIYYGQGRLEEAGELREQNLVAQKQMLGEEHPETLSNMTLLAVIYFAQGRLEEARELGEQALIAQKQVLGEESAQTLNSIGLLAGISFEQGRLEEARELQERALIAQMQVLGEDSPSTQTRGEDAITLMKECAWKRERVLGPNHFATVQAFECLAAWRQESTQAASTAGH